MLTPVVPFMYIAALAHHTKKVREEAATTLGRLGRPEGVPALLRASQNADFLQNVGQEALELTLPTLTFAEHYGNFGGDVVPNLCCLLDHSRKLFPPLQGEWQLTLLNALETVGDARAIEPLLRLTEPKPGETQAPNEAWERAAGVLEILRERVAQETAQATLLRGSEAPIAPQTLLRSYEGKPTEEPSLLLRSGDHPE